MDETRAIILAMTDQAIREWADGTVEPMFPMELKNCGTTVNVIWNTAANVMAYGFLKGLEAGHKLREEAVEK